MYLYVLSLTALTISLSASERSTEAWMYLLSGADCAPRKACPCMCGGTVMPQALSMVGPRSTVLTSLSLVVPGSITPGQRMIIGESIPWS